MACAIITCATYACRYAADTPTTSDRVHAFYYGWYATDAVDGRTAHWNHDVLGVPEASSFPGGDDIGANYYPAAGTYSSNDAAVLELQMSQMAHAGIGVVTASWWGPGTFEDRQLAGLLDAAANAGLKVNFHLEPFPGRGAESSRRAIEYVIDRYGEHPAFYRRPESGNRPMFYVYDSYLTPAAEWARLLAPEGDITIRGTEYDAVVIGLWVNADEEAFMLDGNFDGFYTYFAADGFTYGSTWASWERLASWARQHDLLFIPSVGPGYIDTRIRPWNASTTRSREDGAYYDRAFQAALNTGAAVVSITSFNEWHEGTQIEPAVPATVSISGYQYQDYRPLEPGYYLERTRYWVDVMSADRPPRSDHPDMDRVPGANR